MLWVLWVFVVGVGCVFLSWWVVCVLGVVLFVLRRCFQEGWDEGFVDGCSDCPLILLVLRRRCAVVVLLMVIGIVDVVGFMVVGCGMGW